MKQIKIYTNSYLLVRGCFAQKIDFPLVIQLAAVFPLLVNPHISSQE